MPKIIALVSLKGGVGKTTSAVHIAASLSQHGKVVGVDTDDRVRSFTAWTSAGHLPFETASLVKAVRIPDVDYIVIDVRGGIPDLELADLVNGCDLLIMPSNPELMSLDALRATSDRVRDARESGAGGAQFAALLTMTKPGRRLSEAQAAMQALDIPYLSRTVRFSDAFKDASSAQSLVRDVKTNRLAGECWQDYEAATAEVLTLLGAGA